MRAYFIRRLLLILPTLLGITVLVFLITRLVPGGPVERMMSEMRRGGDGAARGAAAGQNMALSEENIEQLKEHFALDKPMVQSYLIWLGVWPREDFKKRIEFAPGVTELPIRSSRSREKLVVHRDGENRFRVLRPDGSSAAPWKVRGLGYRKPDSNASADEAAKVERAEVFRPGFSGVLTGDFGLSYRYNDPVVAVIAERLPVSTYYGLMTLLLTYLISIPLGIIKATQHKTWFDNFSSAIIFAGYAIPSYALGAILVTWLAVHLGWFPAGGFTSFDFLDKSTSGKVWDILYHSILPLTCYVIGHFAFLTMLMKNQLMDNLAADYIRTAVAKGMPYEQAVRKHALRNAFIPIATHLGNAVSLFVAGSFLIERIFDIDGFGLLGFDSIVDRDYPVVMGVVFLTSFLLLAGNVVSDLLVALVDPRVRFT
ncbi:MAG: ABC transporter permease [Verrucomicrobiales bacterium]